MIPVDGPTALVVTDGPDHARRRALVRPTVRSPPRTTCPGSYAEPREFRPEHWPDGVRRPASEYLPFGGGIHRCIGSSMATTELTVMLARLLARGRFTLEPQRVRSVGMSAMRPANGIMLSLDDGSATTPR
ncbi:cytochrome P450 [Naumannella sp. ID2617S]|nr:cytochrome P450 [Naumannella sp. ID2617S]